VPVFFDELSPVVAEFTRHPVAFMGGFVSGLFHLNLSDDPVKSWLERQSGAAVSPHADNDTHSNNGSSGPQTISIE
jgi:hypothetical protein